MGEQPDAPGDRGVEALPGFRGAAQIPALPERDAEPYEHGQFLVTFDTLSDHPCVQPAGEDVDQFGQRPPHLVAIGAGDQVPVEFDQVRADHSDLAQSRVAGTNVVHGDEAAALAQRLGGGGQLRSPLGADRLVELEDEPAQVGVDPDRGHLRGGQQIRHDVDGEKTVGREPFACRQRRPEHPGLEVGGDPGTLGGGEPQVGRGSRGCSETCQCLVSGDDAAPEIDDRLEDDARLTGIGQGVAQCVGPFVRGTDRVVGVGVDRC